MMGAQEESMGRTRATPTVKTITVQTERKIPLFEKVCPTCGATFTGAKVAVYDTVACRQKANYKRNREAYLQAKAAKYQKQKATIQKQKKGR